MIYGDEKIILERKKLKLQQPKQLNHLTMDGNLISFSHKEFPFGISMDFPDTFAEMSLQDCRNKYPYENRPAYIYSNSTTTTNFCFHVFSKEYDHAQNQIVRCKALLKQINPAIVLLCDGYMEEIELYWFDYLLNVLDGNAYILGFFFQMQHKLLYGSFNTNYQNYKRWKPVVLSLLATLKEKGGKINE